jgi:hypothetical protein
MRLLVIALLALAAVWYFFIRPAAPPPPAPPAVALTPLQRFQAVLSTKPVKAAELAGVCSAYPQLGIQLLRGKQFQINGTVAEVRTSGIQGRRADVVLEGPGPRKIVLVVDLDQYSRPSVNFRYIGKFEVVGTELLYLFERSGTLTKKIVITQAATVTQYASLKTLGGTLVEFNMVNGPAWAQAETNKR